jgi:hypothetical protein
MLEGVRTGTLTTKTLAIVQYCTVHILYEYSVWYILYIIAMELECTDVIVDDTRFMVYI